ncbi:hypothetical protein [Methylomonas sp. MgM2]
MKLIGIFTRVFTGTKLFAWASGLAGAIAAAGVIVQTLDNRNLEIRVAALTEENGRLNRELESANSKFRQVGEERDSLKSTLGLVKAQYDIPDSIIGDILRSSHSGKQLSEFKNLATLNVADLNETTTFALDRTQTTRVLYPRFTFTISVSEVQPNGKTTVSIGYILPDDELPESLLIELHPSQYMTISSADGRHLFYVGLLAVDPSNKRALVEVKPMIAIREMAASK